MSASDPRQLRRLLIIVAAIGLLCLGGWAALSLSPWGQLSRGGRQLAAGNLEAAATALQRAAERLPTSSFARRQLAQAELRRGNPEAAVVALTEAARLAPDDLLIQRELALAHEAAGDVVAADAAWQQLGFTPERHLAYAERDFAAERYAAAAAWFERAVRTGAALAPPQQFQSAVAAAISRPAQTTELIGNPPPETASTATRIPGAQLRWLRARPQWNVAVGAPLGAASGVGPGTLRWNGPAALLIDAPQSGAYLLRVQAQQNPPAPTRFAVAMNGQQIREVTLDQADSSSTTVELPVELIAGPQAVIITFLNDGAVNGVDRNAVIEWVELIPVN